MLDLIIRYSFYLLFFLTPLFWNSSNYELFEFNKMMLTYGITIIIAGAWALKCVSEKRLVFNRTPLDIPLLLFLASQILSTVFSMDMHTSLNGYYSRLNGGLYSTIAYLMLYWAFVSNIKKEQIKNLFRFMLASGFIISVYAIMEHFGVSPSCVILHNQFNAGCWVQDVQARVFATLGQPNWLAGYLAMLIFPALYFFLTVKEKWQLVTSYLSLVTMYLAFTFTYSRGPTLGLIGGLIIFLLCFYRISTIFPFKKLIETSRNSVEIRRIFIVLIGFLIINILFGSALTSFRLVSKFAAPPRPTITLPPSTVTQLENGGTESGQIRFIVWKGALSIFNHNVLFGSGVETFAYSYYQYRPIEHNQTSEWDFLYNKAHNEYLNYLATTGIIGFGAYMLVIGAFLWWSFSQFKIQNSKFKITNQNLKLNNSFHQKTTTTFDFSLLTLHFALLAAYVSYLIYNFFLFSVVILALFFFLFPAIVFVGAGGTSPLRLPQFLILNSRFLILIYKRPLYANIISGLVVAIIAVSLFSIFQSWYADIVFAQGQKASDDGNPAKAFNLIASAVELNRNEPFYRSELAYNAAASAIGFETIDATTSAELVKESADGMDYVLKTNPNNVSFYRTAIRTYFELASLDKDYESKTLSVIDRAIALAPTDPKLYFNKARILNFLGKKDTALQAIKKALELKPDYLEAKDQLKEWAEATESANKKSD